MEHIQQDWLAFTSWIEFLNPIIFAQFNSEQSSIKKQMKEDNSPMKTWGETSAGKACYDSFLVTGNFRPGINPSSKVSVALFCRAGIPAG